MKLEQITGKLLGDGGIEYQVEKSWGKLPDGWRLGDVVGIATDSQDRVYVFNRSSHPLVVFDLQGNHLFSWGEGMFIRPHGITIGTDDMLYLTDEYAHVVIKCTQEGAVKFILGNRDKPSDTGYIQEDYKTIQRPGGPFNRPTKVAISPKGDLYIADGYGNCQIHKFDPTGKYLFSWGEPGVGPGQFQIPHGIVIDAEGTVYVADRENNRLQVFSPSGDFISEWLGIRRPNDLFLTGEGNILIACMFAMEKRKSPVETEPQIVNKVLPSYLAMYSRAGSKLFQWENEDVFAAGGFWAAHGVCEDSKGNIYLGEIVTRPGRGPAPENYSPLTRFTPV